VNLTAEEYRVICASLGRAPNEVERHCFEVMWSEHCAYKHSREILRRLPTAGARVLQGPGENAGVVDLGEGWAVVWKMESHNHPSAVDPYHGAATGVGGIIRDVLAMGARPIALLDSLRFGPLDGVRARRLLHGVVGGIAGYGNRVGIPTVGGEVAVDPAYRENPLVNVACLGLVRSDRIARGRADPPGAVLLYAGARTGRDGIGGAAFASDALDAETEPSDRAAVQIGDPFAGKCLVEATLEALGTGHVLGLQDMGAGGLTCAAAEMSARSGRGVVINLDRVPCRESSMTSREILLSESQERMLLVAAAEHVEVLASIFRRWGLVADVVGRVTEDGRFHAQAGGASVADLPAALLTHAPSRRVVPVPPSTDGVEASRARPPLRDPARMLLRLLATPEVCSKQPIFEQYDHMVQVRTVVRPGFGAAVLRLPESPPRGLALTVDGNGRWCAVDPYGGAAASVLEAAANLACVGAEPLAVTDCLNFASPEVPEVFWTFVRAVDGIAAACRALDVPVVGGNVSFYNEGPGGPILPTPVVAMVGLIPDVRGVPPPAAEGDGLILLGPPEAALGGSLYAREAWGKHGGALFAVDFPAAARTLACVREAVRRGVIALAHDVSDGGLAVALAECCLALGSGADILLPAAERTDAALFGEGGTRIVCAVPRAHLPDVRVLALEHDVPLAVLGQLEGRLLRIRDAGETGATAIQGEGGAIVLALDQIRRAWMRLGSVI